MNTRLILDFPSVNDALSALQRIAGVAVSATVSPTAGAGIDNPEFGSHVAAVRNADGSFTSAPLPPQATIPTAVPVAPASLATVGFGQGVTLPAGAIPIQAPTSTPAPASAVAAPVATAPAAPSGIPVPPLAPTAPAPTPAAAAPAPTAPAAPTSPAGGVDLDKSGLPWDVRIHAGTKTKNADGTWRQKRELDPTVKATVEAELRQLLAMNAAAAGNAQPPAAPPVSAPAQAPVAAPIAPTAAAPQPSTPETPAASGASPSEFVWTFGALAERLTPLMVNNTISQERVAEVLKRHNLNAFGQLALVPNVIPAVAAELGMTP